MARGGGATAPLGEPHDRAPLRRVEGGRSVWVESSIARPRERTARLSRKERSVLRELARGYSTDQIAAELVVSPHTIRTHIKNGMRKLEAKTRAHAVAIALSEGAIEFDPAE
jgi:DNA-binding CsgD family transcriptional regulator